MSAFDHGTLESVTNATLYPLVKLVEVTRLAKPTDSHQLAFVRKSKHQGS